jgi:hypothetical protein
MVRLELVDGRKGLYDVLVLVTAYSEPLSFHELLFILNSYFKSEHSYYPVSKGYLGKGMLLSAISCVAVGVPIETVLSRFKLYRKGKKLNIIDKRKTNEVVSSGAPGKTQLHELM